MDCATSSTSCCVHDSTLPLSGAIMTPWMSTTDSFVRLETHLTIPLDTLTSSTVNDK